MQCDAMHKTKQNATIMNVLVVVVLISRSILFLVTFSTCSTCNATATSTATAAFSPPPLIMKKIVNDYQALTRRVTAYHILLPPNSEDACLELKRNMLKRVEQEGQFLVDVMEDAAKKFSRDDTTNQRGGLLGELLPQGACPSAILDRACFEVPLGSLQGPITSEFGIHILLVTERTNCPKLDGTKTKLVVKSYSSRSSTGTGTGTGFGELIDPGVERGQQVNSDFILGQL